MTGLASIAARLTSATKSGWTTTTANDFPSGSGSRLSRNLPSASVFVTAGEPHRLSFPFWMETFGSRSIPSLMG